MGTLVRPMLQSGAFFGFFFAIGHVLRCDDNTLGKQQETFYISHAIHQHHLLFTTHELKK
jgi:hypothetical protein